MRILHVIPAVAPRYGGPSAAVVGMAAACRNLGLDVLIATTNADGDSTLPVETDRIVEYKNAPVVFFDRQFSEAFKYSRPLARWLDSHVEEFDAVHVHAVFSHASIAAGRACRRMHVPYIVRPLGTLDPWSLGQKRFKKRVFWHMAVKNLVRGAAAMHYTTADEQRLAEELVGGLRGVIIPLGMDLPSGPSPRVSERYILSLGRLHPKKNLEVLIDAFGSLMRVQPELLHWRLVLAGDGESAYVDRLRERAAAASPACVEFAGWLDGREKASVIERAALVALISHQENFGLAALEALAYGVPVLLGRDVNLAPDVDSAGAGWVCAGTLADVRRAMGDILSNDAERCRRGRAGRHFAGRFAWPVVARELSDLYAAVANN